MNEETKDKIKNFIIDFAKKKLSPSLEMDIEKLREAYPFHSVFFGDDGIKAFKVQRSLVTSMGTTLIPTIAKIIGEELYEDVKKNHKISGSVDIGMEEKIGNILQDLYEHRRKPDSKTEWSEILASKKFEKREMSVKADLYIGDYIDGPLFIELKSPLPNKDVCSQSKWKMLIYKAIMHEKGYDNAQAYLGLWYNPYISEKAYLENHGIILEIMDFDNEILLGRKLWDKIGGKGTYDELLEILNEVREYIKHLKL
jgi:type II restriction enzyme